MSPATKATVLGIQELLPEGHFSTRFLAACVGVYSGDEIALLADLMGGTLPLHLKKLYLRIGAAAACLHACMHACTHEMCLIIA